MRLIFIFLLSYSLNANTENPTIKRFEELTLKKALSPDEQDELDRMSRSEEIRIYVEKLNTLADKLIAKALKKPEAAPSKNNKVLQMINVDTPILNKDSKKGGHALVLHSCDPVTAQCEALPFHSTYTSIFCNGGYSKEATPAGGRDGGPWHIPQPPTSAPYPVEVNE